MNHTGLILKKGEEEGERLDKLDNRFWEDQDQIAEIVHRFYVQQLGISAPS
ncbi:hypothetical protein [Paenibacillus sp. GCM10027629]|uniref:hypothetical protein n=1 Tax=Paenibacillus sp. GCM10027629 TaxID=3273414 RepID=UPI0036D21DA1